MGFLDAMKQDIARSASSKGGVFGLAEGEKATIRFLHEPTSVLQLKVHGRFSKEDKAKGYTITCPLLHGHKNCPFDSMNETEENKRNTKENYGFLVWDYRDSTLKAMVYKANNMSPIPSIADHFENLGSIANRNMVITRNNKKGYEIRYNTTPLDPSSFPELKEARRQALAILPGQQPNFSNEPYIFDLIKTMYAQAWAPFLLKKPLVIPIQYLTEIDEIEEQEVTNSTANAAVDNLYGGAEEINLEDDDDFLPGEK